MHLLKYINTQHILYLVKAGLAFDTFLLDDIWHITDKTSEFRESHTSIYYLLLRVTSLILSLTLAVHLTNKMRYKQSDNIKRKITEAHQQYRVK